MSERVDKDIDIKDLPAEETLTPEEKERLAGAGRFRPTFEALEARELMTGPTSGAVPPPTTALVRTMEPSPIVATPAPSAAVLGKLNYKGASDASAALAVGKYVWVGDDKSTEVRLYDSSTGGAALKTYNLGPKAVDIEGVTRDGNIAYWIGSGGSGSDVIYKTEMGTDSQGLPTLKTVGEVVGLRASIESWGASHADFKVYGGNGAKLDGPKTLAEAQGTNDKNWYNIEGIVMKPGESWAYVAFRAPLVGANGEALLLRVNNFTALFGGASADFGDAIQLQLGENRGIRDIVYNPAWGKFLILGGCRGVGTNMTAPTMLYTWDGTFDAGKHATGLRQIDVSGQKDPLEDGRYLSYEAIGQMTGSLIDGTARVQLFSDDGGSTTHGKDLYKNGKEVKDEYGNTKKRKMEDRSFHSCSYLLMDTNTL
jgi:hypothetical protein